VTVTALAGLQLLNTSKLTIKAKFVLIISMSLNLAGKKFLVTGAGRGIGRAIAETLNKQGSIVYALNRSKEPLDSLVQQCPGIKPIQADMRNWDEIRDKLKDLKPLDGLVNNAGKVNFITQSALDYPRESIAEYVDVQIYGMINTIQIVGSTMVKAGKPGSIVNLSSTLGHRALRGILPYCVTKAAVEMITKQFAVELGVHNIRVNSVNPTWVRTEYFESRIGEGFNLDKMVAEINPRGRMCELMESVWPVLYLLSDLSSFVSGTFNLIDGAMLSTLTLPGEYETDLNQSVGGGKRAK